jgi:hypothetical protein
MPNLRRGGLLTPLQDLVADYGPAFGLAGVTTTLIINGRRKERQRRRDNHARAIEAIVAYAEMSYRIRRRRHEAEHRSSERTRLSDAFSDIQAELASCQAIIRADPDHKVRYAYEQLVQILRKAAGELASAAWNSPPVQDDQDMSMPDVHTALADVRAAQQHCESVMATSTGTTWKRRPRLHAR